MKRQGERDASLTGCTQERPAIDVTDRAVEPRCLVELVDKQIREIAAAVEHGAQLQMDGEGRCEGAEIDEVQIECLRMSCERRCGDILHDHRWDDEVWIAWNDDLDGLREIRSHHDLVAIAVQK